MKKRELRVKDYPREATTDGPCSSAGTEGDPRLRPPNSVKHHHKQQHRRQTTGTRNGKGLTLNF